MLERLQTDILILGTGGAGLFAALHALQADPDIDITIASKGLLGKSGCTRMVQGGYNVSLIPGDSVERHFMDTIEGGKWLPNDFYHFGENPRPGKGLWRVYAHVKEPRTFNWTPTVAGQYLRVAVWVRSAGSTSGIYEASTERYFAIAPATPGMGYATTALPVLQSTVVLSAPAIAAFGAP